MKQFLRKTLNDILPTKTILARKKIIKDGLYPICIQEEETILHVLWTCPTAVDVWGEFVSLVRKWHTAYENLFILWRDLLQRLET